MPTIRIISGRARGRKILVPELEGLRPSTDRVRTTVFNWLMPFYPLSTVLDCCCGSGILGLEALSRGAEKCIFLDLNPKVHTHLQKVQQSWNEGTLHTIQTNAITWLQKNASKGKTPKPFDLIFLDPPFTQPELLTQALQLINKHQYLHPNGILYLESPNTLTETQLESWHCHRYKKFGQVHAYLLKHPQLS